MIYLNSAKKATGVDGVTKQEYGVNLEANLRNLAARLKRMGYRPDCSPHKCVDDLGRTIQQKKVSWVAEADIRSFFDKVNHDWPTVKIRKDLNPCRRAEAL
ncbi:MAG: hypothetical protein PHO37_11815 [Kiritimatiellae bacterium]|nr:hypothetical protein [Kiritimatiellia bacterium]